MTAIFLIFRFQEPNWGVEKVNFLYDTPKSPKGDLLNPSDLKTPAMRDCGVKTYFFSSPHSDYYWHREKISETVIF
jgi:hypothetical protein